MKCRKCQLSAVIKYPQLCKSHFLEHFEATALKTISKYKMVGGKILVAASGGKDSISCLHILSLNARVEALAIDEGISGYRQHTLRDLKSFCHERKIPLHIASFKKEFGMILDDIKGRNPCSDCGILRRYLLNRYARILGADKIATGHNLDDELQSVMMNMLRNQPELLARLGPVSGVVKDRMFVPRIKPLYMLTEKEVASYAHIKKFNVRYNECPYAGSSYRSKVLEALNSFEAESPGSKRKMMQSFLKMLPFLKKKAGEEPIARCSSCGEPSRHEICQACLLLKRMKRY